MKYVAEECHLITYTTTCNRKPASKLARADKGRPKGTCLIISISFIGRNSIN
jgi:hypothetical protein